MSSIRAKLGSQSYNMGCQGRVKPSSFFPLPLINLSLSLSLKLIFTPLDFVTRVFFCPCLSFYCRSCQNTTQWKLKWYWRFMFSESYTTKQKTKSQQGSVQLSTAVHETEPSGQVRSEWTGLIYSKSKSLWQQQTRWKSLAMRKKKRSVFLGFILL